MNQAPACSFVIFGATGDLSARKLIPALYALHRDGLLNPRSQIVGYSRRDWSNDDFRQVMKEALVTYASKTFEDALWQTLAPRLSFIQGQYDDETLQDYKKLAQHLDDLGLDNRAFYTATPPAAYESIARCLGAVNINQSKGWTRLVIEKPFGTDLESAKNLNQHILQCFNEAQIYRIDHYLAKETAQNLAALRFANTLFEPIWSNRYIDHVQITMAEPLGVEGRGSFYEEAGVVRDVFQNHLLQLVALVATEPPAHYNADDVRDEKVKVFRAMRCVNLENAVIGQYSSGNGMKGYREEEGVSPQSRQATFMAVECHVENWRWAGVPFYVRSGKRLEGKASEIVLHFKKPPHIPFSLDHELRSDRIVLRLVPDEGILVRFNAKIPGQTFDMNKVNLNFSYDGEFKRPNPDAYETLLLDVMLGDATLFMRADEVEAQWRIASPLLAMWESSDSEPTFYAAGSKGPQDAYTLLERQGRHWHKPNKNGH